MDQQPTPARRPARQFSLGSLLTAVVFVGIACAEVKNSVLMLDFHDAPLNSPLPVLWLFAIPVALCGAVGGLRGRPLAWLCYGIVFDLVVTVAAVVLFFPTVQ